MNKSNEKYIHNNVAGHGFTLIELMIVVVVVGVLAAIAIPQYQQYTARAQAAESLSLAAVVKTAIIEYYQSKSTYPAAADIDVAATGKYGAISLGENGVITYTFKASVVVADLKNATIVFSPSDFYGVFSWLCSSSINQRYLPEGCSHTENESKK